MVHVLVIPLRRMMVLATFTVMALCAASATVKAQQCPCSAIKVSVDPGVACAVQLFAEAPLCRYAPVTVLPGKQAEIACCNDMKLSLVDMNGVHYTFGLGTPTSYTGIKLANGCCVDAILKITLTCAAVIIVPSQGPC